MPNLENLLTLSIKELTAILNSLTGKSVVKAKGSREEISEKILKLSEADPARSAIAFAANLDEENLTFDKQEPPIVSNPLKAIEEPQAIAQAVEKADTAAAPKGARGRKATGYSVKDRVRAAFANVGDQISQERLKALFDGDKWNSVSTALTDLKNPKYTKPEHVIVVEMETVGDEKVYIRRS